MAYGNNGGRQQYGNRNGGGGGYNRGNNGGGQQRRQGGGYQNRGGNNRCTEKQAKILQDFGYNPNCSFEQASRIIDQIAANGWQRPGGNGGQQQQRPPQQQRGHNPKPPGHQYGNGYGGGNQRDGSNPCTDKQAATLEKYGYDPNVTFDEASQIIDDLASNGWQRPDDGNQDGGQYGYDNGGYQPEIQYGDDGSAPWDDRNGGDNSTY